MLNLAGYEEIDQLYAGNRTLVYRAIREGDRIPVIIKVLRNPQPNFNELVQFRNQYVITDNLDSPYVVRPLSLEHYNNGYALIMPDYGAIALSKYWQQCSASLAEFLNIAIQLADALHYLTQQRIIHKDIKPANILIHPETREVKLIDFSISTLLPKEQQQLINPNVLEGTLAYISPEQTARMNRGIDYRTDFYSLGVTFYELLTGQLPFTTEDPMELIHCHIAKMPILKDRGENAEGKSSFPIPQVLSEIVLKLMAKNAEDRYQSALGLKHDLEQCLQQFKDGEITSFEIGEWDICDRFTIPEKLYGRETEVAQLLAAFNRVVSSPSSQSELLLVAGFSGIGKTAVVNEVHKPIVRQRGYFIKGKFDQFNRKIPFSAFVQAFRDLMGQLLGESDADLNNWKTKILSAVRENAQVIIDVIPELEHIIGKQPPVPELSASAAQNRFNLLFSKFVRIFSTKKYPLTIFVDDLQWADSASLNLLKLLTNESEIGYLLMLGAYRDNEVFPTHPLMTTLHEIQKQGGNINTLTLTALNKLDITRLVADTLLCEVDIATPLSQLVYQKTQGNPFFTTQFLQGLYEDNCIIFEPEAGYWQCDLTQVSQLTLTDDVVEFMVGRLRKLPVLSQEMLKLAACIGNQFDLATLAIVSESDQDEVAASLWAGLQEGFVIPQSENYKFFQGNQSQDRGVGEIVVSYRFLHDRVQQAAYFLISQEQKEITHLKIGQLLLNHTPELEREKNIFTIVNQFNIAINLIKLDAEKLNLAHLNLVAGKKAKASSAYADASQYISHSLRLLPQNSWHNQYDLTLEVYINAIEAEYLTTNFDNANRLAEAAIENAKTLLDCVRVYELKIQMHVARIEMMKAMEVGLKVLKMLEVTLVDTPPDWLDIETLIDLPELTDPYNLAVMRILMSLISTAYFFEPELLPQIIFTTISRSILYGNSVHSAYGYVLYGLLLCGFLQDIETGYSYGQLALKLLDKFDEKEIKARILLVFNGNIRHWKEHTKNTLSSLQEAIQVGLEVGDIEYASYATINYLDQMFAIGEPLSEMEKQRQNYVNFTIALKQEYSINYHSIGLQVVQNFLEKIKSPGRLIGLAFNEEKMLPIILESKNAVLLFKLYLEKGRLCYLFDYYSEAVNHLELAEKYIGSVAGMITVGEQNLYSSLSILAVKWENLEERDRAIARVEDNQKIMQYWATHAPANYQHKLYLVEAERHRKLGLKVEAMKLYDRAIAGAKENKYIQEEALANELAAKFYLDWGYNKIAAVYMKDAYYCYARWGAKAKTDQLEEKYPQLLNAILQRYEPEINSSKTSNPSFSTVTSTTSVFDLASAIEASQTLSKEISLDALLDKLMQIIIENAGANKGAFLLNNSENWEIVIQCDRGTCQKSNTPLDLTNTLPRNIINTVKRTQQTILINNLQKDTTFSGDPYLIKALPKSLCCTPIVNQGKLIGILYLENYLSAEAFTPDRIEVLNLLTSQAAISIENARLYTSLENYSQNLEAQVEERTEELQEKNQSLQETLKRLQQTQTQLIQTEKMSSLGQMVAGIAHEINNPIAFISGNIDLAREYFHNLLELIDVYEQKSPSTVIEEKIEEIELEYLRDDWENLFHSMERGSDRIRKIVLGLRNFSRLDESDKKSVNLHEGLENTLMILQHRLNAQGKNPEITIVQNYGTLPLVNCYPGQLNQVFLHILSNAIDVLSPANPGQNPEITITTEMKDAKTARISIADNGPGMSENIRQKVFDPFFTTKAVGKGTGLGLSTSYQIVTEQHLGQLQCLSQPGQGTEFMIEIPI